jgi:hypothetical protein
MKKCVTEFSFCNNFSVLNCSKSIVQMKDKSQAKESVSLTVDQTVDLIRKIRNDLIKDFLDEKKLKLFFAEQYDKDLSPIKIEFLKRGLRELLIAPVDLIHYSSLIKKIRETNSASLSQVNHELFYKELELIFKKYNY